MSSRGSSVALLLLVAGAVARCAAGGQAEFGARAGDDGFGGGSLDGGSFGAGGTTGTPPPETEREGSFRAPVATGRFVWTANPDSGRIAIVDAQSLSVRTIEAGAAPTHLTAVPLAGDASADRVAVINASSHDATLLTDVGDAVTVETVAIHRGANAWSVSRSGRWMVAWSDAAGVANPDATEGFQDITVIDTSETPPGATRLTVGYRPTQVVFDAAEDRVLAVTEPGVTVIDLGDAPSVHRDVALSDDVFDDPASRDVALTPDGALALVRRTNRSEIDVVTLEDGAIVHVPIAGIVTDLDLSEDGQVAVAAFRTETSSGVAVIRVPAILDDPSVVSTKGIDGERFGSVVLSSGGETALVFTNAEPNDRLTAIKTAIGETFLDHRTLALKAPVNAVFPTPDARHAVALLHPGAGSQRPGAFSVFPVTALLPPKIQGTDAPPFGVALSPTSDRAVVTTRDDRRGVFEAYLVGLPDLRVDRIELSSPPIASGIVASARRAFVAQQHPEGRLTFIDLDDGKVRTLTGFELDAKVVDGT